MFVYWASHSYVEELLDSGVKAYTYDNGFLHAKTIVIDGAVASVGSANWDIRSFRLNFETNALMYDERVAGELKQAYLNDLSVCTELLLHGMPAVHGISRHDLRFPVSSPLSCNHRYLFF